MHVTLVSLTKKHHKIFSMSMAIQSKTKAKAPSTLTVRSVVASTQAVAGSNTTNKGIFVQGGLAERPYGTQNAAGSLEWWFQRVKKKALRTSSRMKSLS